MNEEEAIEYLKNYKYDNEVKEAIETVLNLLEKKDKEISKLKNNNKELLRKLRNRVKEVKKLTKYSLYKKEFSTLNKQLQKKDKMIDEMAEIIGNVYKGTLEYNRELALATTKEVKQYFKEKVENGN